MNSNSKDQVKLIRESLDSIIKPYIHLIEEWIPNAISTCLDQIGIDRDRYSIERKLPHSLQESVKINKTCNYQYFLTINYSEKPKTFKFLELPKLHSLGYGVINGVQRVFNIKLKKCNTNFYFDQPNNLLYFNLVSLRNKLWTLYYDISKNTIGINYDKEKYTLSEFLIKFYTKNTILSELYTEEGNLNKSYTHLKLILNEGFFSTVSNDRKEKKDKIDFIISSKNVKILSKITGKPLDKGYINFLTLDNLLNLINWIINESGQESIKYYHKNLVNKEWQTIGGYLKNLVERAFFNTEQNEKNKELILKAVNQEKPEDINKVISDIIVNNLNLVDLRTRINMFLNDGSFSQLLDNLNPLSILINTRKVSLLYRGLLSKRTATNEIRSLNPYLHGRTCPITTSESAVIGLVKHLSLGVIINEQEEFLIPYYKVKNGKLLTNQIYKLNFYDEQDKNITDWLNWNSDRSILKVRLNQTYTLCNRKDVDLVFVLPGQSAGWGINLLNYSNHSEPDRLLMSANMLRQALIVKYPNMMGLRNKIYEPLIKYYLDQFLPNGDVTTSEYISSNFLLKSNNSADNDISLFSYKNLRIDSSCYDYFKNTYDSKGNLKITTHSTQNGSTLGNTVRCAFGLWGGYNYEDALVISDRLVKEELFSSLHMETITVPVLKTLAGDELITKEGINLFKYNLKNIDDYGVIKVGSHVKAGDILIMKMKPVKRKEYTPEQRLLFSILGQKNLGVKNNFFHLPNDIPYAWVYSIDYVRGRCTEEQFSKWAQIMIEEYDKEMMDLLRNYAYKYYPKEDLDLLIKDWVSKPKKQSKEILKIINHFQRLKELARNSISKEDCLFLVNINLIREKTLRVGDKLTGLHGNKGVVSRIVPECEMPFDESGNTIDIIISNLSVYGRLNFSQLKESFTTGLNYHLKETLSRIKDTYHLGIRPNKSQIDILQRIFNFKDFESWLENLDFQSNSLNLDSTPFHRHNDEHDQLKDLFNYSEMRRLRCGQTGETYNRLSHVGYMYILKLKHTVDTKFNARSIGSSSLKINQPTRGKVYSNVSEFVSEGQAQKIGTMEKDALIARGVPRFLHELFTFRSDLINFRRKVLDGQIFLNPDFKMNILPEATKVLSRYLTCLGIKMNIQDNQVSLGLYTDKELLSISQGEVKVADTYHYKTRKFIPNGLYCPKIFGSDKNVSCECEKYVGNRYLGLTCPQCGVVVMTNEERRNLFGHVTLVYPIVNLQMFKHLIKLFKLDYPTQKVRNLANFSTYIWIQPNGTESFLEEWQTVNEGVVLSGAEALLHLISKIDIMKNYRKCAVMSFRLPSKKDWKELFELHHQFIISKNNLNSIIIKHILILPKVLRPLIFNPNGSYISSDIVNTILTIIRRNNRLGEFKHYGILPFILEKMKFMLQEAVNHYLWGGGGGDSTINTGSIAYVLKGKIGLARKYILAKRINNSARAVLVQNPLLPLSKCRVPILILKKIFLPLIQKKLVEKNYYNDFFEAFESLSNNSIDPKLVREIIDELVKEVPVVLNRNPTLHSLSLQAFYAEPVDHMAVEVNPLTLKAFAGDIDGDVILITLALANDSIKEIRERMVNHNTCNISDGKIVTVLLKELGLSIYLITLDGNNQNYIPIVDNQIEFYRYKFPITSNVIWFKGDGKRIKTTLGRAYLMRFLEKTLDRYLWWSELNELNNPWTKNRLDYIYSLLTLHNVNYHRLNEFCDRIKLISNEYSYSHNCSFSLKEIEQARYQWDKNQLSEKLFDVERSFKEGSIQSKERTEALVSLWTNISDDLLEKTIDRFKNTQHELVIQSEFRGGYDSLMSITNARGLVSLKPEFLIPVDSSLYEGYDGMEFFNLSNIIDKLIVKSLGTAKGGYFNRQMVEIMRDSPIAHEDCGDSRGIPFELTELRSNFNYYFGRVLARDVPDIDLKRGDILSYKNIMNPNLTSEKIYLRSPISCQLSRGVCKKCFGLKTDMNCFPELGESVGIIAAQAMTEPVTQTLLQTKHLRYMHLSSLDTMTSIRSKSNGVVVFNGDKNNLVSVERGTIYLSYEPTTVSIGTDIYQVKYGTIILPKLGTKIKENDILFNVDNQPCIYAYEDCEMNSLENNNDDNDTGIDTFILRNKEGNLIRKFYLKEGSYDINQPANKDKFYKKGEKIFKLRADLESTEKTLDDAFNDLVHTMIKINTWDYKDIELFNVYAPASGYIKIQNKHLILVSDKKGDIYKWSLPVSRSYFGLNLSGNLRVEKHDLLFYGENGVHPLDILYSGDHIGFALYFLSLIRNIYNNEGMNIMSVNLELFIREFYMLAYTKHSPGLARNLNYLISKYDIKDIDICIRKSLKEAYIDNMSPLSIIVYENIVKHLVKEAISGNVDRLIGIHSKLILGKIIPIMEYFNPTKWFEVYDIKNDSSEFKNN